MNDTAKKIQTFVQDFLDKLDVTNIDRIDEITSFEALTIHMKDGSIARIKLMTPGTNGVFWSVEDFQTKAEEKKGEDWKLWYDENKFQETLDRMCYKHDATLGITWETVEFCLDYYCKKIDL